MFAGTAGPMFKLNLLLQVIQTVLC